MIEIVTHCWCPPGVPWYAEHLRWQYASLWRNARDSEVVWTVCWNGGDRATREALHRCHTNACSGLLINEIELDLPLLFRRAIGRDRAAQRTRADVVWFTDADYLFHDGCVAAVERLCGPQTWLAMPSHISISRTHELGQRRVEEAMDEPLPELDPADFEPRKQRVCIGGVQIVGGDTAREVGYLRGTPWQNPVDPAMGFRSCRCDVAFRRSMGGKAERLAIPGVYRLRHTRDGRDYTRDGEKVGRQAW